jgi:exonuclease VII small subunit
MFEIMLLMYNFYYIIILTIKIWTGFNTIMEVEKMTNEDFQRLVIEKLGNLEASVQGLEKGQHDLEMSVKSLEISVKGLELSMKDLEQGQSEIKEDIKSIVEQTADLTEFRELKYKLDTLIEDNISIQGILGEHEVAIRTIKRRVI